MIHPTCSEVLATIETGLADQIVPHLHDSEAQSAAATIGHLLRHVGLRIETEGQILMDDIARLRTLLADIADWFDEAGVAETAAIRAALECDLPAGVYPALALLGDQALGLRKALVDAQDAMRGCDDAARSGPRYQAIQHAIRDYIAAQLADEAKLIEPAFLGKGPRR